MKLQDEHSLYIREAFNTMKTKEDFLALLNYAKVIVYGQKSIPFEQKQIHYNSNSKANKKRYIQFPVNKKSGGERIIHAPAKGLKSIQKCLNLIFQTVYDVSPAATGFVPGKSIVDNAKRHVDSLYVYNIDLKDFFPSIEAGRIWNRFQHPPFNLTAKTGRKELANVITWLCCHEMEVERMLDNQWQKVTKNVLPQGAPTSPTLTNIICQQLDFYFSAVAKSFGLKYSRYADDITFSSMHNVYHPDSAIKNKNGQTFSEELNRIITEQKFHIKESKTRLQKEGHRQIVTGLLVNEKANVPQRYIKQLRMWLYYWEQYGFEKANSFFLPEYMADKGHTKKGKPNMENVIAGKLDYLKMVKGAENELYLKLKGRLNNLITKDKVINTTTIPLGNILSLINYQDIYRPIEQTPKNLTGKLRINIDLLDSGKRIVKLKRKIIIDKGKNLPLQEFIENNEREEKEIDLSKHKPIDVTRFLLNFRSSEGLKFLTHDYDKTDSLFEYVDTLKVAKKEFEDLSSQFVIPPSLWTRINQFAFGDPNEVWWFNKVTYRLNWKSHELLCWMEINPNTHPIKNEDFEKGFITPFKKSIEIKAPELEYIIKNKLAENFGSKYLSFDIKLVNLDKANFYTNVDALQVGISYIFKAIRQRFSNSNKVRIEFSRRADAEGRKRIIKIVHIDSVCNKPLDKNELFQGDLLEAEKALFGICDWSTISK